MNTVNMEYNIISCPPSTFYRADYDDDDDYYFVRGRARAAARVGARVGAVYWARPSSQEETFVFLNMPLHVAKADVAHVAAA